MTIEMLVGAIVLVPIALGVLSVLITVIASVLGAIFGGD